ncbi:hypothetical protein PV396_15835 [Streptomyces sp. ME02-8801-2C]|uniref:hypothetical protein n=1 Tax=Streptomyces sp. ME02-8801-2C TaxID=3028680 RepID=UPI0029B3D15E|nr:hypothetical protein [Streptomyces sp. ME02-8801-2C]MDX3453401.1 hypothetical protein [Streptomyces sp. ME02-8801-2C]
MSLSQPQAAPTNGARPTQQRQTPLTGLSRYSPAVTSTIGRLLDSPDRRPTHPTFNSAV